MLTEFGDALLVDVGQEGAGQEHAVLRMPNARQRFRPGEAFALEIDFRLIPDFEPLIPQRLANGHARPLMGGGLRPHRLFGLVFNLLGFLGQPLLFGVQRLSHGAFDVVGQVLEGPRSVFDIFQF